MKSVIDDGGIAFPNNGWEDGMTLRDYFAAKAMQIVFVGEDSASACITAENAYKMADAMLKARSE